MDPMCFSVPDIHVYLLSNNRIKILDWFVFVFLYFCVHTVMYVHNICIVMHLPVISESQCFSIVTWSFLHVDRHVSFFPPPVTKPSCSHTLCLPLMMLPQCWEQAQDQECAEEPESRVEPNCHLQEYPPRTGTHSHTPSSTCRLAGPIFILRQIESLFYVRRGYASLEEWVRKGEERREKYSQTANQE